MRIRSIKPEFWESESLGRVSREARLLFVGLFTCCDDAGRARASSRLLASRLFPYDVDAIKHVPKWLAELEAEKCVRVYDVDGERYLDIPKWTSHQKIDKPSASKLPEFARIREGSRGFSAIREGSIPSEGPDCMAREDSRKIALEGEQGTGKGNREGEQVVEDPHTDEIQILDYLNEMTGVKFQRVDTNLNLIRSRLSEVGGDVAGVKVMIARQCAKWKTDPKMSDFLCPKTLFGQKNFTGYYDMRELPVAAQSQPASGYRQPTLETI